MDAEPRPTPRKLPPTWLLGLTNLPVGVSGAVALMTVPQMLSGRHVPEPRIAAVTALALVPCFCAFLVAPILDVRLSRRTYAVLLGFLTAAFTAGATLAIGDTDTLGWWLFAALFAVQLYNAAIGGWLGSLVPREEGSQLGAWFVVSNISGFGVTAIVATAVLRGLPAFAGAGVLGAMALAPMLIFPFVPAPGPDRRLARESFGQFAADLATLVRRPVVLQTLLLFSVPLASFALTNTLGGLGRDYRASEGFVSLIAGTGVTVAGLIGSLSVPVLTRRMSARTLYIAIGGGGALFTLACLLLPRTPTGFTIAMIGQNVCQAAALATVSTVAFQSLGRDNPFAASQFALLIAASALPISYMQVLDGQAYGRGGLPGMYLVDGGLGLLGCTALLWLIRRWTRSGGGKADTSVETAGVETSRALA